MIYLAYPIDASDGGEWIEQVARAKQALVGAGWVVFDPGDAWTVGDFDHPDPRVQQLNLAAVDLCDALVAFLPDGVRTLGVPMEVERARGMGKPMVILGSAASWAAPQGGPGVMRGPLDVDLGALDRWLTQEVGQATGGPELAVQVWRMGRLPTRSYADDAGIDLYVAADCRVRPGQYTDVPCDIAVRLPPGTWGLVMGRSSAVRSRSLQVLPGIIDTGYRGPIFTSVIPLGDHAVDVAEGERLAQLILLPNYSAQVAVRQVEQVGDSARGVAGFGSSGV